MSGEQLGAYQPPSFDLLKQTNKPVNEGNSKDQFALLDFDDVDLDSSKDQQQNRPNDSEIAEDMEPEVTDEFIKSIVPEDKPFPQSQTYLKDEVNANSDLEEAKNINVGQIDDQKPDEINIIQKPPSYLKYLTIDFYRQFFNVTHDDIIIRLKNACFPLYSGSIFDSSSFDLYGPIWILITLTVAITIFGNLVGWMKFKPEIYEKQD